jgi:thiamine pyrophosphate-dependent acetolactate synthase large subunit-like protein
VVDARGRGSKALLRNRRDALNPVIDALHRYGRVEFIHVRHEEAGTFAAAPEADLNDAAPA